MAADEATRKDIQKSRLRLPMNTYNNKYKYTYFQNLRKKSRFMCKLTFNIRVSNLIFYDFFLYYFGENRISSIASKIDNNI